MKRLPTDLEILNRVYDRYYGTFASYDHEQASRSAKDYVPIDIAAIAADLRVDGDIVFGRLYYHLDKKHGYRNDDGSHVHLFTLKAGGDTHCVNFPVMASVLADLRDQARRHHTATWIAVGSLLISIASIVISVLTATSQG